MDQSRTQEGPGLRSDTVGAYTEVVGSTAGCPSRTEGNWTKLPGDETAQVWPWADAERLGEGQKNEGTHRRPKPGLTDSRASQQASRPENKDFIGLSA